MIYPARASFQCCPINFLVSQQYMKYSILLTDLFQCLPYQFWFSVQRDMLSVPGYTVFSILEITSARQSAFSFTPVESVLFCTLPLWLIHLFNLLRFLSVLFLSHQKQEHNILLYLLLSALIQKIILPDNRSDKVPLI